MLPIYLQIEPAVKAKRIVEAGRGALSTAIDEAVSAKFPLLPCRFSERLLSGYVTKFLDGVALGLGDLRVSLEKQRADLQVPFEANTHILASLALLDEASVAVGDELTRIAEQENALMPEKAVLDLAPAIEANAAEAVPQESAAS